MNAPEVFIPLFFVFFGYHRPNPAARRYRLRFLWSHSETDEKKSLKIMSNAEDTINDRVNIIITIITNKNRNSQ